ncbi:MAG: 4'-phosphopantetheinyl transferase superfamily protein [Eubacteriales bacterium]|nr:4'-phosphopantetheinyl transferase superfamily protein [Eubacteriales bacterium]
MKQKQIINIFYDTITDYTEPIPHAAEHALGLTLLCRGLRTLYRLDLTPDSVNTQLQIGAHGKPHLTEYPHIHFNISHSHGLVMCAFGNAPLGLDVQKKISPRASLIRHCLSPAEQQLYEACSQTPVLQHELFCRFWTLKESLLKCTGIGISRKLSSITFQFPDFPDYSDIRCSESDFYFQQKLFSRDHVLAVCSQLPIREVRFHAPTQ